MEFQSPYVTAPASPIAAYCAMASTAQFYSAPASPTSSWAANVFPTRCDESNSCSIFDSFEFETSRKFGGEAEEGDRGERHGGRRERGGSLPSMAFADELFDNGRVMPLKPPPRFLIDSGGGDMKSSSERLTDWSPKSPAGSMFRVPFARRNVWNDDYDPFMAALQKVKEENRGRKSNSMYGDDHDHDHHRRTRSLSPLRSINGEDEWGFNKESVVGPHGETKAEPKLKGSVYARWVLYQTQNMGPSPKRSTKKKGPNKPTKPTSNTGKNGGNAVSEDTKMQKIKGIIVRYYTSFGKENGSSSSEGKQVKNPISATLWKSNYFKKFSFKYKGNRRENRNQNGDGDGNRKGNGDSRIVLVKLQPAMCLGYGVQSPRNMQRSELSS